MPVLKRSKETNEPSVDSEVLEKYSIKCKEAKWLLRYRYYSKILSTFVPALTPSKDEKLLINPKCKGKIFPRFNQVGTTSGRFSSSEPNFVKASSSRYWARSRRRDPATFFIAFFCAFPPTRETERPALIAGLTPE